MAFNIDMRGVRGDVLSCSQLTTSARFFRTRRERNQLPSKNNANARAFCTCRRAPRRSAVPLRTSTLRTLTCAGSTGPRGPREPRGPRGRRGPRGPGVPAGAHESGGPGGLAGLVDPALGGRDRRATDHHPAPPSTHTPHSYPQMRGLLY